MAKKIIVIGSGFGGLAVATRLAARGHDVELFEKRDKLGGRAYVYKINGFTFDGGPTVITAPFFCSTKSGQPRVGNGKITSNWCHVIHFIVFLTTKNATLIIMVIINLF